MIRETHGTRSRWVVAILLTLLTASCSERSRPGRTLTGAWWQGGPPDEPPQMLNRSLPFEYPAALYLRRVEGNVMLRLFVDSTGSIVPDSTRLERASENPAFDSAALAGVARLRFRPALRRGVAIPVAMLFPVHFRHPANPRAPGDTTPSLHER